MDPLNFANILRTVAPVIAADDEVSNAVEINSMMVAGLIIPDNWTAAGITLVGSYDGVDFYDIYDSSGAEVVIAVAAGTMVELPTSVGFRFAMLNHLKVRSGTAATPVTQTDEVTIQIILRSSF